MNNKLLEKIAELEHEQWVTWSKHIAEAEVICSKRLDRWKNDCWKPYSELSEEMKEHDRVWARKVLDLIKSESDQLKEDALELASFYGNKNNWHGTYDDTGGNGSMISQDYTPDCDYLDNEYIGGIKAREFLAKYGEKK